MGFSSTNYRKVREVFEEKRNAAEAKAAAERNALHAKYPELAVIDKQLSDTALDIFAAAMEPDADVEAKVAEIREKNAFLLDRRRAIMEDNGIPETDGEPKYDCPICSDRGYTGSKMCDCLRRALIDETFRTSGIGELIKTQSFETFSTEYYKDDRAALEAAELSLVLCRQFADGFSAGSGENILMIGATGLGKTHLSTSVAKAVIERGFDVVYETAQNIFRDFEKQQFGKRDPEAEDLTSKYFDCDLLIIDDLGTELKSSFTVSCLYNMINTRLNRKASMIVNTNLTQKELRERYEDRITSRLFGEFSTLLLKGKDIRSRKLFGRG